MRICLGVHHAVESIVPAISPGAWYCFGLGLALYDFRIPFRTRIAHNLLD